MDGELDQRPIRAAMRCNPAGVIEAVQHRLDLKGREIVFQFDRERQNLARKSVCVLKLSIFFVTIVQYPM